MNRYLFLILVLIAQLARGDTPPSNVINARAYDYQSNPINSQVVGPVRGLDAYIINPSIGVTQLTSPWVISGTVTATPSGNYVVVQPTGTNLHAVIDDGDVTASQGAPNIDANAWPVKPTDGTHSQSYTAAGEAKVSVTQPLPAGTNYIGDVGQHGAPWSASVSNFPATQSVTQGTSPWVVSGTVSAAQSGTWTVQQGSPPWSVSQSGAWTTGRTWNLSSSSDSVVVSGGNITASVTQGTSPWVISGTVTANAGTNLNTSALALAATQTDGTQKSQTVDGSGNVWGPRTGSGGVNWMPVINLEAGATGSAVAARTLQVGGSDGTNLRTFSTDSTGKLNIANFPATQAVTQSTSPWVVSGTVAATQSGSWTTGRTWALSGATDNVIVTGGNIAVTGTVTANIGTTNGLALDTTVANPQGSVAGGTAGTKSNLMGGQFNTTPPTLTNGQQSAVQFDTSANLKVNVAAGTVAVTQSTSPWVTNISQFGGSNVVTGTGTSGSGIPRVTVSNDSNVLATQSGTWTTGRTWALSGASDNVVVTSGNITVTGLLQTQGSTTSGQSGTLVQGAVTTGDPSYTTGQTSPLSLNVRGGQRTTVTGMDSVTLVRNDYSTTNVTTAAYVQLVASTGAEIHRVLIFDSSGQDFVIATGAAASEVDQIQIPPGGWDAPVDFYVASGTRLSIKSKSATANSGILLITALK